MFRLFPRHKIGLSLGSGADRGFAHLGILQVFSQSQIPIDAISGSSIGSLVAAYYALHGTVEPLIQLAASLRRSDLWRLLDFNNPKISFIKGEKIRHFLQQEVFSTADFSQTKIPLRIAATVLEDGSSYSFSSGSIVDAVMASSSVPGLFPPWLLDGRHLVDGGLSAPIPLALLSSFHYRVLIGVDLYGFSTSQALSDNLLGVLDRTYKIYLSQLSRFHSSPAFSHPIYLSPHLSETWDSLTFSHFHPNFDIGKSTALAAISQIRKAARL